MALQGGREPVLSGFVVLRVVAALGAWRGSSTIRCSCSGAARPVAASTRLRKARALLAFSAIQCVSRPATARVSPGSKAGSGAALSATPKSSGVGTR